MSDRARGEGGRYTSKLTEQDVLKAFDYETSADEPMLTVTEIADAVREHFGVDVSGETVRRTLHEMEADGTVASKEFGARAVGWTALVGPRLSASAQETVEETEGELDAGETASHDQVWTNPDGA
jgi:hypothetical protein